MGGTKLLTDCNTMEATSIIEYLTPDMTRYSASAVQGYFTECCRRSLANQLRHRNNTKAYRFRTRPLSGAAFFFRVPTPKPPALPPSN